jgi:hypothetical protein
MVPGFRFPVPGWCEGKMVVGFRFPVGVKVKWLSVSGSRLVWVWVRSIMIRTCFLIPKNCIRMKPVSNFRDKCNFEIIFMGYSINI